MLHQASDIVDYVTCERDTWPMCFFDFTFQLKLPQFWVYRVRDYPSCHVDEDYFYPDLDAQ